MFRNRGTRVPRPVRQVLTTNELAVQKLQARISLFETSVSNSPIPNLDSAEAVVRRLNAAQEHMGALRAFTFYYPRNIIALSRQQLQSDSMTEPVLAAQQTLHNALAGTIGIGRLPSGKPETTTDALHRLQQRYVPERERKLDDMSWLRIDRPEYAIVASNELARDMGNRILGPIATAACVLFDTALRTAPSESWTPQALDYFNGNLAKIT